MKYVLDKKTDEVDTIQLIDTKEMKILNIEDKRKTLQDQFSKIIANTNILLKEITNINDQINKLLINEEELKEKVKDLIQSLEKVKLVTDQFNLYAEMLLMNESNLYKTRLVNIINDIELKIKELDKNYQSSLEKKVEILSKGEDIKVPENIPIEHKSYYIKGFQEALLGMKPNVTFNEGYNAYKEGYNAGQEYGIKRISEELIPKPEKKTTKGKQKKTEEVKEEAVEEIFPTNIMASIDLDKRITNIDNLIKVGNPLYDSYKVRINGFDLKGFEKDFFFALIYTFSDVVKYSCVPVSSNPKINISSTTNKNLMLEPKEFYYWKNLGIGRIGESGLSLINTLSTYFGYDYTSPSQYRQIYDDIIGLIKRKIIFIAYIEYIDQKYSRGSLISKKLFFFTPELLKKMQNESNTIFNFSRSPRSFQNFQHLEKAYSIYSDLEKQIKILEKGNQYD